MDYRAEMKQLRDTLNENARLYYTLDRSTMSDYEYDHLYRRLQDLEREHPEEITLDSPTQRVGDAVRNDFAEVLHPVPVGESGGCVRRKRGAGVFGQGAGNAAAGGIQRGAEG